MKSFLAVLFLFLGSNLLAAPDGYYRFPTIHDDRIVFSAEGDLWQVNAAGGTARRLTRDQGIEGYARFSPDGRWIAFSASYEGNVDVYVIPGAGGEPRRLTWHPAQDQVLGWTADAQSVLFCSSQAAELPFLRAYTVPVAGGQPRALGIGPVALASLHAGGRRIAFNRFPGEMAGWRGYRGGTAQDVWVGDLEAGAFERVTDFDGSDGSPLWDGDRIVFLSDRFGDMNLCSLDLATKEVVELTHHQGFAPRWPDLQAGRVVYSLGADLHLLDLASGSTAKVAVELPSDRVRELPRTADAAAHLESYALSADGKRIVMAARGEIWLRPVAEGRVVALTRSPGVRERAPALSSKGDLVACISDQIGEQQPVLLDASGKAPPRVLRQEREGWMNQPVWSPRGTHLAYSDLTFSLFVLDVETGATRLVDRAEEGEIRQYAFSPDGRWLAYARADETQNSSIYLHDLETGRSIPVTSSFTNDTDPVWDPEGKFLYFLSNRTINPVLGDVDLRDVVIRSGTICGVILRAGGLSPFLPEELLEAAKPKAEPGKTGAPGEAQAAEPAPAEKAKVVVQVDPDGIETRVFQFPVPPGDYAGLSAAPGKVFFLSAPILGLMDFELFTEDETPRNALQVFDLEKKKVETALAAVRDYTLSADGKKVAWRTGREILVADAGASIDAQAATKVDPSTLPLTVDPRAEWQQIFHEAWRLQRDFYWAENLAHVDWEEVGSRYGALLPRIATRDELNDLLSQMILELGTSHTYTFGGDLERGRHVATGLLGADVEPDTESGLLRFTTVFRPEAWETGVAAPLTRNDVDVRAGDYLFAIDGVDLGASNNVYQALQNLAGRQVLLTVGRTSDRSQARDVQIETLKSDAELRYRDWCRRNREYVGRQSGGELGYFHLPDMMGAGLVQFIRGYYPQIHKKGLVIDARYNGGGFVSQLLIERLMRTPVAYFQPRRGPMSTIPERTHIGHKVVLTNQLAGSDGDIFPKLFQLRRLGPVIGMRTWGGVVGLSEMRPHQDGGLTTQPTAAWWDPASGFSLENRGVDPDIVVDLLPGDWQQARDPQLDRGIEELLRMIREHPVEPPPPPAIPDKSRH